MANETLEAPQTSVEPAPQSDPKASAAADPKDAPETVVPGDVTGSGEPSGTGTEPPEFDWRAEVGVSEGAAPEAPRENTADRIYREQTERAHEGRAKAYERYVTAAHDEARTYGAEILELQGQDLDAYAQKATNLIEGLHSAHNSYFGQVLFTAAGLELSEDARGKFWSRRYPDWRQFFHAAFEDARDEVRAEYEAQVKAGKLVKEADVEKIVTALKSQIRRSNDDGSGESSKAEQDRSSGGSLPSIAEWSSWTLERREEARKRDPGIELKLQQRGR